MADEYRSTCKDCGEPYGYSEASLNSGAVRGLSRPERCPACRAAHSRESRSVGIPQIAIRPIGRRKDDLELLPGRLGGIEHPPRSHEKVTLEAKFGRPDVHIDFGITDDDIRLLVSTLNRYQVAVVVGPTGSGKSTFLPYRLMVPPEGVPRDTFTKYGQIVITQPRIQATRNIAGFVARDLHGSSLGAGFDVGYRHSDAPNADWRNKLVFITDGTLINWIVSGQIGNLSVIMIDEAHERSLNIDLILGLLKQQLPRYPHLKLIIASATINSDLFMNFFGGADKVACLKFKGVKQHKVDAYFPEDDQTLFKVREITSGATRWVQSLMTQKIRELLLDIAEGEKAEGDILGFLPGEALIEDCIADLREMIAASPLLCTRAINCYPLYSRLPLEQQDLALAQKVANIVDKVLALVRPQTGQGEPILALLLDIRSAGEACDKVQEVLIKESITFWNTAIIPEGAVMPECRPGQILFTSHDTYRRLGGSSKYKLVTDRRVIVSTNLAETSLTVDGIVYVVDSGLIKEARWDGEHSASDLQPRIHSRAGCIQRMGRAGRIRDGEAHLLYTDDEFENDDIFTPHGIPEIQRTAIEQLILKAKAAGIDDIEGFDWIQPPPEAELRRAPALLRTMGALDEDGDLTAFGLELESFITEVPIAGLLLAADRYACGVEMATLAALLPLNVRGGLMEWNRNWDMAGQDAAVSIRTSLMACCGDDLDFLLKIHAVWAEAESSLDQEYHCRLFLLNREQLDSRVAPAREQFIGMLAIGKKSEEERPTNFGMLDRLRIVLAVTMPLCFFYRAVQGEGGGFASLDGATCEVEIEDESVCRIHPLELFVALKRRMVRNREGVRVLKLSCLVKVQPEWLEYRTLSPVGLAQAIRTAVAPRITPECLGLTRRSLFLDLTFPLGGLCRVERDAAGVVCSAVLFRNPPLPKFCVVNGKDEQSEEPLDSSPGEKELAPPPVATGGRRRVSDLTDPEILPLREYAAEPGDAPEEGSELVEGDVSEGVRPFVSGASAVFSSLLLTDEIRAAAIIIPHFELGAASGNTLYQVAGHGATASGVSILLHPVGASREPTLSPGTLLVVEPRKALEAPGGGTGLTVIDQGSGAQFIVDPESLSFGGRREMIPFFQSIPSFEMITEQRADGSIRLSCLPLVEKRVALLLKNSVEGKVTARLLYRYGHNKFSAVLLDEKQMPPEVYWGARFKAPDNCRKNYQPGDTETFEIDPSYGAADVYLPDPRPALLEFVEKEKFRRKIFWNRHRSALHTLVPLAGECRDLLLELVVTGGHATAIKKLYLESNRMALRTVTPALPGNVAPKKPRRRPEWSRHDNDSYQDQEFVSYEKGESLSGTVLAIYPSYVLVKLHGGGSGKIQMRNLTNEPILDPREELYADQEVEVVAIGTFTGADGIPSNDLRMKGVRTPAPPARKEFPAKHPPVKDAPKKPLRRQQPPKHTASNVNRTVRVPEERLSLVKRVLEKICITSGCGIQVDSRQPGVLYIRGRSEEMVELAIAMIREQAPQLSDI